MLDSRIISRNAENVQGRDSFLNIDVKRAIIDAI